MLSKIKKSILALFALSFLTLLAPLHTASAAVSMSVLLVGEVGTVHGYQWALLGYNPTYRIYF